jgi:hypothetical protein
LSACGAGSGAFPDILELSDNQLLLGFSELHILDWFWLPVITDY